MSKIALCWYYHLPSIASDAELSELARESLAPLLAIHAKLGLPLTLAITGSLLERIGRREPRLHRTLAARVEAGGVELAGTFQHEIFPPAVPYRHLLAHLERDREAKAALAGRAPTTFHPPNFTWVALLGRILGASGFERVLLHQEHFTLCHATQTWRWDPEPTQALRSVLLDTTLDARERRLPHRHPVELGGERRELTVLFRDFELVRRLSFGTEGAIHRPLDGRALDEAIALARARLDEGSPVVLADDGDRVNAISLSAYERFLEGLPASAFGTVRGLPADASRELAYIPSYSIAPLQAFWLGDLDAVHYLALLGELYALEARGEVEADELLELEDVFFLFWKVHARKQAYLDRVHALLARRR